MIATGNARVRPEGPGAFGRQIALDERQQRGEYGQVVGALLAVAEGVTAQTVADLAELVSTAPRRTLDTVGFASRRRRPTQR